MNFAHGGLHNIITAPLDFVKVFSIIAFAIND
jgi:hypothetical protein